MACGYKSDILFHFFNEEKRSEKGFVVEYCNSPQLLLHLPIINNPLFYNYGSRS